MQTVSIRGGAQANHDDYVIFFVHKRNIFTPQPRATGPIPGDSLLRSTNKATDHISVRLDFTSEKSGDLLDSFRELSGLFARKSIDQLLRLMDSERRHFLVRQHNPA